MTKVDLLLMRDAPNGPVKYVAIQEHNLILEGPHLLIKEAQFLAEFDRLEKCLVDSATRPSEAELKKLGTELADALFPGGIQQLVRVTAGKSLRLGVCCADADLKRIPWEYVIWPGDNRAPTNDKSIARIVPVADGSDILPTALAGRKLRVALVVADPSEMAAVPWEQLERELNDTFDEYLGAQGIAKQVELITFGNVTRKDLYLKLGQQSFDIIHFIGHGEPNGLYMLSRVDRKADLVPTAAVANLFCRPNVQLVLLSACSTGQRSKNGAITPLAEDLVLNKLPAVVGSQLPIPASTIAVFCAALYQKLLENGDIDEAVAFGRTALQVELSQTAGAAPIEWGIPVLYRRPGRSKLFA